MLLLLKQGLINTYKKVVLILFIYLKICDVNSLTCELHGDNGSASCVIPAKVTLLSFVAWYLDLLDIILLLPWFYLFSPASLLLQSTLS